jgi:hypothetical protein
MARPRKSTKAKSQASKELRAYRTQTEEVKEEPKKDEVEAIKEETKEAEPTPKPTPKRQLETVIQEEYYNACKQDLILGGQRFVPGARIPKEYVTEASASFYLQGGHIASRKKLRTVRKLK